MKTIIIFLILFASVQSPARQMSQSGFVKEGFLRHLYDNITGQIRSDMEKRCSSSGGYMTGFNCQKENQNNGIVIDQYEVTCTADCSGGGSGSSGNSSRQKNGPFYFYGIDKHATSFDSCDISVRVYSYKIVSREDIKIEAIKAAQMGCAEVLEIENEANLGIRCKAILTDERVFSDGEILNYTNNCNYSEELHEIELAKIEAQREEQELIKNMAIQAELERSRIEKENQEKSVLVRDEVNSCLKSVNDAEIKRANYTVKGITNSTTLSDLSNKFLKVIRGIPATSSCNNLYACQDELESCKERLDSI